jgi:hypothetical protein
MKAMRIVQFCVIVTFSTSVVLLGAAGYKAKPWTYDPGDTGLAGSAWVTQVGLPDAGGSNHALFLSKNTATAVWASGGATIELPESTVLTELGFDYRNDGHCGAGAPRFNVYTGEGQYYFVGCSYGIHTPVPDNPDWTRVRFTANADFYPANANTPAWDGSAVVTGIDIVFDEGTDVGNGTGFAYLDNINVNGTLIGKPGLAQ